MITMQKAHTTTTGAGGLKEIHHDSDLPHASLEKTRDDRSEQVKLHYALITKSLNDPNFYLTVREDLLVKAHEKDELGLNDFTDLQKLAIATVAICDANAHYSVLPQFEKSLLLIDSEIQCAVEFLSQQTRIVFPDEVKISTLCDEVTTRLQQPNLSRVSFDMSKFISNYCLDYLVEQK
jgi:hypothetical protein